ncbi:hypothetical protein OHB26_29610 [Nocardia sp. NBC_01503]|nr:hypothetical protein [Nocardia sp. NBC_01503]WTL31043.1 hypothetical protein OHB26_29610 [Nocardia sp. NBC_01503]
MKRKLFLIMALIAVVSTFDYATTAGHYALVVAAGVLASFLLIEKSNRV